MCWKSKLANFVQAKPLGKLQKNEQRVNLWLDSKHLRKYPQVLTQLILPSSGSIVCIESNKLRSTGGTVECFAVQVN